MTSFFQDIAGPAFEEFDGVATAYRMRDTLAAAQQQHEDDTQQTIQAIQDHADRVFGEVQARLEREQQQTIQQLQAHADRVFSAGQQYLAARYEQQGEQAPGTTSAINDVQTGFPIGAGATTQALGGQTTVPQPDVARAPEPPALPQTDAPELEALSKTAGERLPGMATQAETLRPFGEALGPDTPPLQRAAGLAGAAATLAYPLPSYLAAATTAATKDLPDQSIVPGLQDTPVLGGLSTPRTVLPLMAGMVGPGGLGHSAAGATEDAARLGAAGLRGEMAAADALRAAERESLRAASVAREAATTGATAAVRPRVLGVPRPTLAEAASVAQSGPLGSPSSLLNNFLSGGMRTLQRVAQEAPGGPGEAIADVAGMGAAIPEALARAAQEFRAGPSGGLARGLASESGGVERSQRLLPTLLTLGVRGNIATDRFWAALNEAGGLARARSRGLQELDAAELAGRAADFATYKGQVSPVAEALSAARKWVDDPATPVSKRALGTFIMATAPYVRTPERVLGAALSLVSDPFVQPVRLAQALREGNGEVAREATGRLVLGTAVDTWLATEWLAGTLHGDPPQNPAQRRRMEANGVQWNTLHGIPLRNFGTVGQAAGAVASTMGAVQDALQQGKDPGAAAQAGVSEALRWALSQSYLRDLARLGTDVQQGRGAQAAVREVAGLVTRPVAPVAAIVTAFDPYLRDTQGVRGTLLNALPGGRFALPAAGERPGNPATRLLGIAPPALPVPATSTGGGRSARSGRVGRSSGRGGR